MNSILKILAGTVMIVIGVFTSITYLNQLVELVQAGIGPLLVLIGAFIVWLESDEIKVSGDNSENESKFDGQQTLHENASKKQETRKAAQDIREAVESHVPDPEQILSGTVREVREEVSEKDNIDVEQLLVAEKQGKNRKTLINFLERKIE